MENEVEYLIDLKKLDRFESIAFQKAYEKVKKDVRVFEAELRSKIAIEIKKEETDKIKDQLEKKLTVRLEKQFAKRLLDLEKREEQVKNEREQLEKLIEEFHIKRKASRKVSTFWHKKTDIATFALFKIKYPSLTFRDIHEHFLSDISLSTLYKHFKQVREEFKTDTALEEYVEKYYYVWNANFDKIQEIIKQKS